MYRWYDYLFAAWVIVPLVGWVAVEFLSLLRGAARVMAHLTGQAPASAQEAAQHAYAATRNDKQRRRHG